MAQLYIYCTVNAQIVNCASWVVVLIKHCSTFSSSTKDLFKTNYGDRQIVREKKNKKHSYSTHTYHFLIPPLNRFPFTLNPASASP
jgi:hypothetical protein